MGTLIRAKVLAANVQDKVAIWSLLWRIPLYARWARVLLDGGYASPANAHRCRQMLGVEYEIVPRLGRGFVLQPRRWVVERTFAWLGKYRRLSKDYEQLPEVSEALIYIASVHVLVRRLARSSVT